MNAGAFESWLNRTGRSAHGWTTAQRLAALSEYRQAHRQYTYTIQKGERVDHVRCTARTAEIARAAIAHDYRAWTVSPEPVDVGEPHRILGEIDATACYETDFSL